MSVKPLQPFQAITQSGEKPSLAMLEAFQRLVEEVQRLEARVKALENP